MKDFSSNFSYAEMCRSDKAKRLGIDNSIPEKYMGNVRALCENVLQPLRDHFGPVVVNSCYRSRALNDSLTGASKSSDHLTGSAADVRSPDCSVATLIDWAHWIMHNCEYKQLIIEKSGKVVWLHVSYVAGKNRKEVLVLST